MYSIDIFYLFYEFSINTAELTSEPDFMHMHKFGQLWCEQHNSGIDAICLVATWIKELWSINGCVVFILAYV